MPLNAAALDLRSAAQSIRGGIIGRVCLDIFMDGISHVADVGGIFHSAEVWLEYLAPR
ncbi:hypothetical protein D3C84_789940 [compost metagenome]